MLVFKKQCAVEGITLLFSINSVHHAKTEKTFHREFCSLDRLKILL